MSNRWLVLFFLLSLFLPLFLASKNVHDARRFNILSLELPHGAETFRMTFEPEFPAVVKAPVARPPQNVPATIQQEIVLQRVPIGSGSNAIVSSFPLVR
ncbi:hypothetical protein BS17DRAFT_779473, partial [Gyrodon lividus]